MLLGNAFKNFNLKNSSSTPNWAAILRNSLKNVEGFSHIILCWFTSESKSSGFDLVKREIKACFN